MSAAGKYIRARELAESYKSLEGIQHHPLFQLLTPKQKDFLLTYLETSDGIAAAEKAFNAKKPDITSMRLLRNAYISKLVGAFHGYEVKNAPMSKTELVGLVSARLRDEKTKASEFTKLVELYLGISGRKKENQPLIDDESDSAVNVDEMVRQIEQKSKLKG